MGKVFFYVGGRGGDGGSRRRISSVCDVLKGYSLVRVFEGRRERGKLRRLF